MASSGGLGPGAVAVTILANLLETKRFTVSDDRPTIGMLVIDVNLDLGPFLVSTSQGGVLLHPGKVIEGVRGQAPFNWFDLKAEPLGVLMQYVIDFVHNAEAQSTQSFPNVLTDVDYNEETLQMAIDHINHYDLAVANIVIERELALTSELDETAFASGARIVVSDQLPVGTVVLSAEPQFVGQMVLAGDSAGFILHNFHRGMFVIHEQLPRPDSGTLEPEHHAGTGGLPS